MCLSIVLSYNFCSEKFLSSVGLSTTGSVLQLTIRILATRKTETAYKNKACCLEKHCFISTAN